MFVSRFFKKLQLSYFGQYFESYVVFKTGVKLSHVSKFGIEVLSLSQIVMVLNSNSSLVHHLKKCIVTNVSSCLPRYVLMVAYCIRKVARLEFLAGIPLKFEH